MIFIIQSLWNQAITDKLVEGAESHLRKMKKDFEVLKVPGALEIPQALEILLRSKPKRDLEGAIACAAIIKGETYHFEMVAAETSRGLMDVSLRHGLPVANAVLACFEIDQALERAGGNKGNKGEEAAHAVCEMLAMTVPSVTKSRQNPVKRRKKS